MGARADGRAVRARARDRERRPLASRHARAARHARRNCCAASARRCSSCPATTTSRTRSPRGSRAPRSEFERQWETTEPVYRSERILAVGLNSVRPWRNQCGRLRDAQLARAAELLRALRRAQLRVAVLHHHLIGAPWRSRKKPVARRNHVLASLVDAGAELIVAGHIHQSTVAERREFEIATGGERGVAVVDRARARAAAAAPPRRGARPPRLRVRRDAPAHPHVHVARRRLGAHGGARVRARATRASRRSCELGGR